MTRVKLGISTCPNDTFAFHGLIQREVDWRGLDFDVELIDIQQLNDRRIIPIRSLVRCRSGRAEQPENAARYGKNSDSPHQSFPPEDGALLQSSRSLNM